MSQPLVTVVVPAYNAELYLEEALVSILERQIPNIETIVVDDGSTDRTRSVAAKFPVRVVRVPHRGAAAARNEGYALARGEFVAGLDADDHWTPGKLEAQLAAMDASPHVDAVYGWVQEFQDTPTFQTLGPPRPGRLPGTMLMRRSSFERVGRFDATLHLGDFMDFLVRCRELGMQETVIDQVCLERRIHANNLGRLQSMRRGDYFRVAKRSLELKRMGPR